MFRKLWPLFSLHFMAVLCRILNLMVSLLFITIPSTKGWGFRIPGCPQAMRTVMPCLTSVAALGFTENLDLCFIQPFSLFCALYPPQEGYHPGCSARISQAHRAPCLVLPDGESSEEPPPWTPGAGGQQAGRVRTLGHR